MAHNIDETTGKAAFFSVKKLAWHGLGTVLENCPTSLEAIVHAGMNFSVKKRDTYTHFEAKEMNELNHDRPILCLPVKNHAEGTPRFTYHQSGIVKGNFATTREDTESVLGVVKTTYEVFQNTECFAFFDELVKQGKATYETAGCLDGGRTVFITAKMTEAFDMGQDDTIEQYLLLTNSHDGTSSIMIAFTPVRVVCNNTLRLALSGLKDKITIRHSKRTKKNVELANKILHTADAEFVKVYNTLSKLKNTPCSDLEFTNIVSLSFFTPTVLGQLKGGMSALDALTPQNMTLFKDIEEYRFDGPGQDRNYHNMYGTYNAITGYFQNTKAYTNMEQKFRQTSYEVHKSIKKAAMYCANPELIKRDFEQIAIVTG